jgi:hypothetical protein
MKLAITSIALASVFACGVTPNQASDGTKLACTLVQAYSQNAVVDDVCASVPDIAAIVADIAAMRASKDAGTTAKLDKCRMIPTTKTCATEDETLSAIRKLKASK